MKALGNRTVIVRITAANQIRLIEVAAIGTSTGFKLGQFQQQCPIRKEAVAADLMEGSDVIETNSAGRALVSERAVNEAVRNHPSTAFKRRFYCPSDVVSPRGGEEQRLGLGCPVVIVEQQSTNNLSALATAGLTRLKDVETEPSK